MSALSNSLLDTSDRSLAPSFLHQKPGFRLAGWNTEPNGTGITYSPGASLLLGSKAVLHPVWLPSNLMYSMFGTSLLVTGYQLTEPSGDWEIPPGVTEIDESAFACCGRLTTVGLPASVKVVGAHAFLGCFGLKKVSFPGLTRVGTLAFHSCWQLQSVTLPASIEVIESGAFGGCSGLTEVTLLSARPPVLPEESQLFLHTPIAQIRVPAGSREAYAEAPGWKEYRDFLAVSSNLGGGI